MIKVSPTMVSLPALTPSMLKVQYQEDDLETHDKCVSTDPLVLDFDTDAFSIPKFVLPDAIVTDSATQVLILVRSSWPTSPLPSLSMVLCLKWGLRITSAFCMFRISLIQSN